jgi:hypothetical protein
MTPRLALSIKQPWAALIVAGRKTIEVRRWATRVQGPIFIHAARLPDERPQAWHWITDELRPATQIVGGLIGIATLTECRAYRDAATFVHDTHRHLNDPDWFAATMYGFVLADAITVPFVRCPGNIKFFEVAAPEGAS